MRDKLYVMMLQRGKTYNKMKKADVVAHVENIRGLDDAGLLELCGAFKGYPGMAGTLVLRADSYEQAEGICKTEPLVAAGFSTYKLYELNVGHRENNYLL